jgi:hypothetical protein
MYYSVNFSCLSICTGRPTVGDCNNAIVSDDNFGKVH